ncbi:PREDICTED: teratocarcinoma-derived growth factor 1 [Nipponia nippon]|uniref:teratocarcinoma-derived growth factor 1 n=1 Tax=Nipponia nippon TaxID=128390 RepID=UPI000511236B|nr:PREDICTED: teratocarcinoma-derived growth factor 1 [Nipponia nippon]
MYSEIKASAECKGENCNNSPNQENQSISLNTFTEINNLSSKRKRRNPSDILPFIGLTHTHELKRNCYQNGGTCFLGTFCICPKYLTGRYCEHDKLTGLCGMVRHGEWTKDGCLLCQCVHGVFHCFPHGLRDGCGLTKENPPDWMPAGPMSEGLSLQHKAYLLTAPTLFPLLWQLL